MRRAFSLVELSIVLVILGLLVGGILAGQSLIRAAELRSVNSDFTKYKTATYAFRDKYFSLPGDMANATSFWGAFDGSTGLTNTCKRSTTPSTGTLTCNGNASGLIGEYLSSDGCDTYYERFRMWQHLTNAGLIEANLTGVFATGNQPSGGDPIPCRKNVIGSNVPVSRIQNAGFMMAGATVATQPQWGAVQNRIFFGSPGIYTGNLPLLELIGPAITTQDAWNLDTKMDDGQPFYGSMLSYQNNSWGTGNCLTSSAQNAAYDLAQTGNQCALSMKLGL